jgi:pimeloyl-ACP methyl ester carboxylesterase
MQCLRFIRGFAGRREAAPFAEPLIRHHSFEVNRLRIHYLQAGTEGCPVLLLHGGGLDAAGLSFQKTIPALAKRHRVFAPDLPGFGQSDPMPVTWRVEECVEFVGRFLDALGLKRVSLVGVSMGGAFAVGFTLLAPERVERLVLVDSAGLGSEIPGGLLSYLRVQMPLLDELSWTAVTASRTLTRRNLGTALLSQKELFSEEVLDQYLRLARRAGAGTAFRQLQRSEYQWKGMRTNYLGQLSEIKVPTLLVHGMEDRIVPVTWAERAHRLIKNSTLELIPECGHLPPIEKPDLFNRMIRRFLLRRSILTGYRDRMFPNSQSFIRALRRGWSMGKRCFNCSGAGQASLFRSISRHCTTTLKA